MRNIARVMARIAPTINAPTPAQLRACAIEVGARLEPRFLKYRMYFTLSPESLPYVPLMLERFRQQVIIQVYILRTGWDLYAITSLFHSLPMLENVIVKIHSAQTGMIELVCTALASLSRLKVLRLSAPGKYGDRVVDHIHVSDNDARALGNLLGRAYLKSLSLHGFAFEDLQVADTLGRAIAMSSLEHLCLSRPTFPTNAAAPLARAIAASPIVTLDTNFGDTKFIKALGRSLSVDSCCLRRLHLADFIDIDIAAAFFRGSTNWKLDAMLIGIAGFWREKGSWDVAISDFVHSNRAIQSLEIYVNMACPPIRSKALTEAVDKGSRSLESLAVEVWGTHAIVDQDWLAHLQHLIALNNHRKQVKALFDVVEAPGSTSTRQQHLILALQSIERENLLFEYLRRNEFNLLGYLSHGGDDENDD